MSKFFLYVGCVQAVFATFAFADTGNAQVLENTYVSFQWDRQELEKAFTDIQNQSECHFTFDRRQIRNFSISGIQRNLKLVRLLKYISGKTGLKFTVTKNLILVKSDPALVEEIATKKRRRSVNISIADSVVMQRAIAKLEDRVIYQLPTPENMDDLIVNGRITSEEGEPLIGATVMIKETGQGTVTDENGLYSIVVPESNEVTLVISYVGFQTREFSYDGRQTVNIQLAPVSAELNEVVVVGYGTMKKENLTGAVDQASAEVLESRPISNLARGLQGVIPNLNIVFTDGTPGSSPEFNIRGITSINGGSPLIVIDGIPSDPALVTLLNPADIESISVLKDAASAAIYGARGAFGVILIKTKSGNSKRPVVNYNAFAAVNTPTILPEAVTDTYLSMSIYHDALKAWNGTGVYTQEQLDYARARSEDPSLPEVRITNEGKYEYYGNTDWYDEIYQEFQPMMQHNLSVSGGSERVDYYLSGSFLQQDGIYEYDADHYKRYNLRSKLDIQLTDWLSVRNNTFFNNGVYDYKTFYGGTVTIERYAAILGNAQEIPQNPDGSWTYPAGLSVAFLRDGGPGTNRQKLFQNSLGLEMSFLDDRWKITGDYTYQSDGRKIDEHYRQVPYYRNSHTPGVESIRGVSRIQNTTTDNAYHVFNLYSTFEQQLNRHRFQATVGFNQELRTFSAITARRDDLVSDLGSLNLAIGDAVVDGSSSEWAVRGVFYRLNYSFMDKYLLEFNGRYDGTSRFPQSNRFGFFPSVSAGWRISEEPFFEPLEPLVSSLKLRTSYGTLGNQQIPSLYAYIPTMSTFNSPAVINGQRPLAISAPGLVTSDLTWEKVTTLDVGIDLSLWSKLDVTFDWYQRETKDMLTKGRTLPAVLGTSEPQENAADLLTKGWEISLKWNDSKRLFNKPFNYHLGFVFGDYTAEITRFDNPNFYLGDYYVGQQFGEIWGYETLGFFQSEEEIAASADHSQVMRRPADLAPGDLKFADLNNDGVIDVGDFTLDNPGDMRVVGNSLMRKNYGINGGFDWSNFNFSFFFQGIGQHDFLPGRDDAYFWSVYNRPYNTVLSHIVGNYWTPENRDAYFPRLFGYAALGTGKQLIAPQSRYIQDASYLRLKNVTLGYTLPKSLTRRIGIERLNFYVSGENVWENSNMMMPVDPELLNVAGQAWGDGQNYPYQRTFSAGVNVTF